MSEWNATAATTETAAESYKIACVSTEA